MHARWALGLNEYDFSIVHKPGVENSVADTMSRLPVGGDRDFTGARLHDNDNENPARALALMAAHFTPEQVKQSLYADVTRNRDLQDLGGEDLSQNPSDIFRMTQNWQERALAATAAARTDIEHQAHQRAHQPQCVDAKTYGSKGLNVLELFGGIGAGLEMLLRNGVTVLSYRYVENDLRAREVMRRRLAYFVKTYPHQISHETASIALEAPHDARHVGEQFLEIMVKESPGDWFVFAGWPCQDLSSMGKRAGILKGQRSSLFWEAHRILETLKASTRAQVGWILENVAFQTWPKQFKEQQMQQAWQEITQRYGQPVLINGALAGAPTHRERNLWTNLGPQAELQWVLRQATRDPSQWSVEAEDCLSESSTTQVTKFGDRYPNVPGQRMVTLPTLMRMRASKAFREGGPGMVEDRSNCKEASDPPVLREPYGREKALLLGYSLDSFPGVEDHLLGELMGNAVCAFSLTIFFQLTRTVIRTHVSEHELGGVFLTEPALISTNALAQREGQRSMDWFVRHNRQPVKLVGSDDHDVRKPQDKRGLGALQDLPWFKEGQHNRWSNWTNSNPVWRGFTEPQMLDGSETTGQRKEKQWQRALVMNAIARLENEVAQDQERALERQPDVWKDEEALAEIKGAAQESRAMSGRTDGRKASSTVCSRASGGKYPHQQTERPSLRRCTRTMGTMVPGARIT